MTINLPAEQETLIAQAIATGAYQSPEEVIRRALELLHSENEWIHRHQDQIAGKIDRAFEQFERGEFLTAEESVADMEKRTSAWLSEHQR